MSGADLLKRFGFGDSVADDTRQMGRSNYVILVLGFAGILVLSLFMKHLLQVTEETGRSPVGDEIIARFGERIDGEVEVHIKPSARGPRAMVRINPVLGESLQRVSNEIGEYVWARLGEAKGIVGVDVMCRPWADGGPIHFDVPKPVTRSRSRYRVAGPKESGTPDLSGTDPKTATAPKTSPNEKPVQKAVPPVPQSTPPPTGKDG